MSVHDQQEAPTVTFPRSRFGGIVFEETARPVDAAGLPVDVVPVPPAWPGPPAQPVFEIDRSSVNSGSSPTVGVSAEDAAEGIFEQYGPDLTWRPVSGGGEVQAEPVESGPVESGPRHAAEEPEAELPPLVELLLNDAVECGACGEAWPCGSDGHAPYVPGEQDAGGEPDPVWFEELAEGRPYGSSRLGRALAAEQEVLAAVERCEADTRRLGAARRSERFAALREELVGVFAAAAAGELVDEPPAPAGELVDEPLTAGGPVDSPVDADHAPNGNVLCEFSVGGQSEVAVGEPGIEDDVDDVDEREGAGDGGEG